MRSAYDLNTIAVLTVYRINYFFLQKLFLISNCIIINYMLFILDLVLIEIEYISFVSREN